MNEAANDFPGLAGKIVKYRPLSEPNLIAESGGFRPLSSLEKSTVIHRIHKWRTRGKKLVPSHESEALEDKQKLQMKTFSELTECLARIPPKITLYGRLFKYNYVGCLLLLMF